MKTVYLLLTTLLFSGLLTTNVYAAKKSIEINFYSAILNFEYDVAMEEIHLDKEVSEEAFEKFDFDLNNTSYYTILGKLFYYKEKLELNDWLYYLLIKHCSEEMFQDKTEAYRTLFCWFLLNKTGYKAQLNYLNEEIILSVFTKDIVYDIPVREYDDGYFVDITSYEKPTDYRAQKYLSLIHI